MTQVRPSVGTPDQKESYQYTRPRMDALWPSEEELAGFRSTIEDFEHRCWRLAMNLLGCFADRLGLDREFFTRAHDPSSTTYQTRCVCCTTTPSPTNCSTTKASGGPARTPTSTH